MSKLKEKEKMLRQPERCPVMADVVRYARYSNGSLPVQSHLAELVGPNGSVRYGTRAIMRAVDHGLVVRLPSTMRKGMHYIHQTLKGYEWLYGKEVDIV